MTKPLPKWIMQSYAKLWQKYSSNEFEHSHVSEIVERNLASVVVHHLKKNGWLEITLNPDDSRKRFYRLKAPEQAVLEMAGDLIGEEKK